MLGREVTHFVDCRIKTYLEKNQSEQLAPIMQPSEQAMQCSQPLTGNNAVIFPTNGWTSGSAYILENGDAVSQSFIYDYMVDQTSDGHAEPTNNFRALKAGYNMFASGHVQSVHMLIDASHCLYKAVVLPDIKKDKAYTEKCAIKPTQVKIECVHCDCPAGES